MNIEIVKCYPVTGKKKQDFHGSLHIRLIDFGIDLRGIYIVKNRKHWIVKMPNRRGVSPDPKEEVIYPIFAFADKEKTKILIEKIREKGSKYITENFLTQS